MSPLITDTKTSWQSHGMPTCCSARVTIGGVLISHTYDSITFH